MTAHVSTLTDALLRPADLRVYLLGLIDFDACLSLQNRLLYEAGESQTARASLVVCEHPPLITVGRSGSRSHLLGDISELKARQIDVRWVNRGGGCWVHVPGQLAVYPIVPLQSCGFGVGQYVERLERALVDVAAEFRISAATRQGGCGLWSRQGQLASIGVAVRRWTTYYGFQINVCPRLEAFRLVRGWPAGDRASSFSAERQRLVNPASVREAVVRKLAEHLGFSGYHLHTSHPTLNPVRRPHVYAGRAQ